MIEDNSIYCGDCNDIMESMDEACVDLTVSSPPYDNLREYDGYTFNVASIAKNLYRITKQGGVVAWVVADKSTKGCESLTSFHHALIFHDAGFGVRTMIYKKAGVSYASKHFYNRQFEYMFLFIKGNFPKTFNPIMDKPNKWAGHSNWGDITSRQKDGTLKLQKTKEENTYIIPQFGKRGDVWEYATGKGNTTHDKEAFEHPAMFPEKLARDHILSWSNPGDLVFDPMMGAATTLKMAKILGRRYIGVDISQKYCDLAKVRLDKYT